MEGTGCLGGAIGVQRLGQGGALGQDGADSRSHGGIGDLGGALEADPDAVGGEDPMGQPPGPHLKKSLGDTLGDGQSVINPQGDLLLPGLLDQLGQAAARKVVPGQVSRGGDLHPVSGSQSPGAAQAADGSFDVLATFRQSGVLDLLGECPDEEVMVECWAGCGEATMDSAKGVRRKFAGKQVVSKAGIGHQSLQSRDEKR